jgi:hypothetical protein
VFAIVVPSVGVCVAAIAVCVAAIAQVLFHELVPPAED